METTTKLTKETTERLKGYNIEVTKNDLVLSIGLELQDIEVIPKGLTLVEVFGATEESNGFLRFELTKSNKRNKVVNSFLDELDYTK